MAIYIQVDISSDIKKVCENFKKYILDRTNNNLREYLYPIEEGHLVDFGDLGILNLDSWTEGEVYVNFISILFNKSNLDHRICDAAINYCISRDILFKRFVKAIIMGVLVCDLKKQRDWEVEAHFLSINQNHGMFHQSQVFRDHFIID